MKYPQKTSLPNGRESPLTGERGLQGKGMKAEV